MAYFPLFVNLEGRRVLVVGGGKIAARRIRTLLEFGCEITVVAPEVGEELLEMLGPDAGTVYAEEERKSGKVTPGSCRIIWKRKKYEIKELEEILEEMEAAMKKREDYSELDTKFHTKIAQCTHNIVMENLLPVIGKGVAVFAKEVAQTEYDRTWISHRKIFCYIRDHKPFEAEMEMQYHLLYNTSRYEEEQSRL